MASVTKLAVSVPTNARDVAALQRQTESDAEAIALVEVTDEESYAFADALLTDIVQRKDAATKMRGEATGPLYQVIRTVEGWFRPLLDSCTGAEKHLKQVMGTYRLEQARLEKEARELAAAAADAGDGDTMIEALTVAAEAGAKPAGARATTKFGWKVKRIAEDLLPDEWWTPDTARLDALAKAHKGDDPPIVLGVTFDRVAQIGAKR
jgi:hypothetical protein